MTAAKMTMTDDPTNADRQFLEERIYEFNVAATRITDGRMMYLAFQDEQSDVIAALSGWTWGGCMAIEFLWVHEDHRLAGYGTQLLRAAEAEGIAHGAIQAVVSTHSFQAPDFYKKHGYEIYGVVDDYPAGHQHIHLRKGLG